MSFSLIHESSSCECNKGICIKVFVKFLLILLKHKLEDADEFECCSSDF